VVYGSLAGFAVVLASATPSLESLYNVETGRYRRIALPDRHGRAELPDLHLIDMRKAEVKAGHWLSEELAGAVAATLERGEQALLFLNRRGYAPLTLCRACGHRMACRDCAAWLVEHRFRNLLQCHHCGYAEPVPKACPQCGASGMLAPVGPGVERLAEEAQARYPAARITVLSSDLVSGEALSGLIAGIARHDYDLVIGTQLVAKGHHFPDLTLAGVVDGDLALETADPRAGERTWQLLSQVAGRTGRGERRGRALVQTYVPEHPLMAALAKADRDGFIAHEMAIRREAELPPFGRLAAVVVSGCDGAETEAFARSLARRVPGASEVRVLGPAPAPLSLVRARHRWRFLVKGPRSADMQAFLSAWLSGVETRGSLRLAIDVDPYSFL
jgi:primosomal protein N' (replication factor Y)